MPRFKADMHHSEKSLRRLSRVQFNFEYGWVKRLLLIVSIAFIIYFIWNDGSKGLIPLIISCFMLSWVNAPAKRNADAAIESLHGKFPVTDYYFFDDGIRYGERGTRSSELMEMNYSEISRISEDIAWFYVMTGNRGIYMIEKASLGEGKWAEFKSFIEDRCDISVRRANGFSMITKRDVDRFIRKIRGQK